MTLSNTISSRTFRMNVDWSKYTDFISKPVGKLTASNVFNTTITEKVTSLYNVLQNRIQDHDSFLYPMTDIIGDLLEDGYQTENLTSDDIHYIKVKSEAAKSFIAAFRYKGEKGTNSSYSMTFTSDRGEAFVLTDVSDLAIYDDEGQIIIVANYNYQNAIDSTNVFMYMDNSGDFYVATAVQSVGFFQGTNLEETNTNTLLDMARKLPSCPNDVDEQLFPFINRALPNGQFTVHDSTNVDAGWYNNWPTSYYEAIKQRIGYSASKHIRDNMMAKSLKESKYTGRGFISTCQLFRNLVVNSSILSAGKHTIDALLSGNFSIASLKTSIVNESGPTSNEVDEYLENVESVYSKGGVIPLFSWLLNVFNAGNRMTVNDEGLLQFSSNDGLTTTYLLSGLISAGIKIVTGIISVITAIYCPVAGMVLAGVSAVATQIPKLIDYHYDSTTLASLHDLATVNAFPYAGLRRTYHPFIPAKPGAKYYDTKEGIQALSNLAFDGPIIVRVPGASLIFSTNAKNGMKRVQTACRSEVHISPSVTTLNHLSWLKDEGYISDPEWVASRKDFIIMRDIPLQRLLDSYQSEQPFSAVNEDSIPLQGEALDEEINQAYKASYVYYVLFCLAVNPHTPVSSGHLKFTLTTVSAATNYGCFAAAIGAAVGSVSGNFTWTTVHDHFKECQLFYGLGTVSDSDLPYIAGTDQQITVNDVLDIMDVTDGVGKLVSQDVLNAEPIHSINGFSISVPKYDRVTYVLSIVAAVVAVAAVATTAAILTVKAKKKMRQIDAANKAEAEKAWSALSEDPSPENYKAYTKAVKKNNFMSIFTGGSKLSKTSYWDDPGGSDSTFSSFMGSNSVNESNKTDGILDDTDRVINLISFLPTPEV